MSEEFRSERCIQRSPGLTWGLRRWPLLPKQQVHVALDRSTAQTIIAAIAPRSVGYRWADDVRLSDLEPRFICKACGKRGADVRPDWQSVEAYAGRRVGAASYLLEAR